eukprot:17801-Eustigmatos_ZCMA.PRE.1
MHTHYGYHTCLYPCILTLAHHQDLDVYIGDHRLPPPPRAPERRHDTGAHKRTPIQRQKPQSAPRSARGPFIRDATTTIAVISGDGGGGV